MEYPVTSDIRLNAIIKPLGHMGHTTSLSLPIFQHYGAKTASNKHRFYRAPHCVLSMHD